MAALVTGCFCLHLWAAWYCGSISSDGTQYATLGKNIAESWRYQSDGSHFPDIIQPPLYPLLIAFVYLFLKNAFFSGLLISSVFKALSVIPLFLIGDRFFNRTVAVLGSVLFIFHPLLFELSIGVFPEPVYCFVYLWSTYLMLLLFRKGSSVLALSVGVATAVAYGIRVEGILLPAASVALLLIRAKSQGWKRTAFYFSSMSFGFILMYLPSLAFVDLQSGRWLVCPKLRLILIHQRMWREAEKSEPGFRELPGFLQYEKIIFRYSPEARDLMQNQLFFLRTNAHSPQVSGDANPNRETLRSIATEDISQAAVHRITNYFHSLFMTYKRISYLDFFPAFMVVMLPLGLFGEPWSRGIWYTNTTLLVIIAASSGFLFSHFGERFFFPIITLLLPWCARGIAYFSAWTISTLRAIEIEASRTTVTSVLSAIVVLSMFPSLISAVKAQDEATKERVKMEEVIKRHVPEDSVVISRKPEASFFSHRRYAPLPYARLDEVFEYSKRYQKGALVFFRGDEVYRPELNAELEDSFFKSGGDHRFKLISDNDCIILVFDHS